MPWRGPEYEGDFPSLGWDLLDWFETYLIVPSGKAYGQPLKLTDEQATFVVRYYAVSPTTGRRVYRRGAIRRAKGWGKSPLLAAIGAAELCGPVGFDGWDSDGEPVGAPHPSPWVQIAACSEDQTGNTYSALYEMLRESPALDEFKVDLGLTRVFLADRPGRLEPVTSSAGSREGQLVTFAVLDETHLWLPNNGGRRLAATIRRNVAKMNGGTVETTNAFVPGENSVAEDTHRAADKGQRGLLYDANEAPWVEDLTDRDRLREALPAAYGDAAAWIDFERIIDEIQDPATDPADARRYYLNQLVARDAAAVDPHRWDELANPERVVAPDERIGVGFDGSNSDDSTAFIGCTADGHLFQIAAWEKPLGAHRDWLVPRLEVAATLGEFWETWNVGRMLCDQYQWQSEIAQWAARFGEERVLLFDTNVVKRMALACDRFSTAIREGSLTHDGSDLLRRHVLAMKRDKARLSGDDTDGRTLYLFKKADTRKIDAGIAAVLALEAAMTMPAPTSTFDGPLVAFT